MSARVSALKALTSRKPTSEELNAVFEEIMAEKQDRSCVFLGAAAVQWILAEMVKVHMIPLSNTLEESLFEKDGPVAGFSRLTRVAHAFDLIDDELARELDYIRAIRNAFAHAAVSLNFETVEVKNVCELFKPHFGKYDGQGLSRPRQQYLGAVIAAMEKILAEIKEAQPRMTLARALQEHRKQAPSSDTPA